MKRKLDYGNKSIEYSVIKSRRVKTSEIIVEEDKVIVRTPFGKPLSEIEKIIREKASWILKKKQLEYKKETPEIKKATFREGSMLPYLGKNYPLKTMKNQNEKKDKIELANRKFLLSLVNSGSSDGKNKEVLYDKWLMQKAETIFKRKIKHYSRQLGVEPRQIIIKNLKNRWGSTTKDNVINLNVMD